VYSVELARDKNQLHYFRSLIHPSTPNYLSLKLMLLDYYMTCYENVRICTIVVRYDNRPILFIPAVELGQILSFFGYPSFYVKTVNMEDYMLEKSIEMACKLFCDFCAKQNLGFCLCCPDHINGLHEVSKTQLMFLKNGAVFKLRYDGLIQAHDDISKITTQVRKSYKSLINWGKREMQLIFVDAQNPDFEFFSSFRLFHRQISGKVTRPIESWDIMFDLLTTNNALLCMAYINDQLVAANYLFMHQGVSMYGTGVYDRSKFDKPLSHWPLIASIHKSVQYGSSVCNLGQVFLDNSYNSKEQNIAFFKQGFSSSVRCTPYWYMEPEV
jgi:hypothetical protein